MPLDCPVKAFPKAPTFSQKGLEGFRFGLQDRELEIYVVDSKTGHDNFVLNRRSAHFYFVLEGSGKFIVGFRDYLVSKGDLVEIPPGTEFSYSGRMKLLMLMKPPFSAEDEEAIRKNPEVS
ncbi:MAG: cupin domain-containing protein [Candidatus Aenigmarchaeota archaeon]|nr:cupin domain-containing protein [Candidatus Aenigmarchaeota archaeon]